MDVPRQRVTAPEVEDKKLGEKFFWLLVLVTALHMIYYYPLLPDRIASHFDAFGRPNGWSGKDAFFAIYAAVVTVIAAIKLATDHSLARLPVSLINLPNKEYWLSPERRAQSMSALVRQMSVFWSATLILLICTMELAFRINLGWRNGVGEWFSALLAAYILFTLVWTVRLIRKFARKPD